MSLSPSRDPESTRFSHRDILAGLGVALIWEKLDSAVISTEQLDELGVTIIGSIPHIAEIGTRQKNHKRDLLLFSALAVDFVLVTGFFAFEILQTIL